MKEKHQLQSMEDDLSGQWIEDWANAGVVEMEAYLAKHASFFKFLVSQGKTENDLAADFIESGQN